MSARQLLINSAAKHQVYLQRYAGSANRQLISFVENLKREVLSKLENIPGLTDIKKVTYNKLIQGLSDLSSSLTKDMVNGVVKDMKNLSQYEADFTKRLYDQVIDPSVGFETVVPSVDQLYASAFTDIMASTVPEYSTDTSTGITIQDALQTYGDNAASKVTQAIRSGYATGQTIDEVSSVIQTALTDRINQIQAKTLARTITNHVSAVAREDFFKDNSDIISAYQIVAVLDDRTTLTCAALDGQVFPIDDFDAPPYHWNCRTTFIGVVDPEYAIDISTAERPAKGDDGENLVSTQTTYNSWLGRQSDAFQDDVLGKERAELFRNGMNVQQFVDENYTPINLDELRNKDNEHIFEAAEKDLGRGIG